MQTPDLSPLVKGGLAFVGLAIALGQYPKLEHWARSQALEAVKWKQGLPYFFPPSFMAKKYKTHITYPKTVRKLGDYLLPSNQAAIFGLSKP